MLLLTVLFLYIVKIRCEVQAIKGRFNHESLTLTYYGKNIKEITRDDFLSYPTTVCLVITHTNLQKLPEGLELLKDLKSIEFTHNMLVTDFCGLKQLKTIDSLSLEGNHIEQLPDWFSRLDNLQSLDISDNCLIQFPKIICQLKNLQTLKLINNKIHELPDEIGNLYKLKEFDLSENNISKLNINITKLQNLGILRLDYNQFNSIPNEVCVLGRLKQLHLSDNCISEFSYNTPELASFKELILTTMPTIRYGVYNMSIAALKNFFYITYFFFDSSTMSKDECFHWLLLKVETVHRGVFNLTSLNILFLARNSITIIPAKITHLKHLYLIALCNNKIMSIPTCITQLRLLSYIGLANNEIVCFPSCFLTLKNYQYLNLNENFIPKSDSIKYKALINITFNHQYTHRITVQELLDSMQKNNIFWNIKKLNDIKIPSDEATQARFITDSHLKRMWDILQNLIVTEKHPIFYGEVDGVKRNNLKVEDIFNAPLTNMTQKEVDKVIYTAAKANVIQRYINLKSNSYKKSPASLLQSSTPHSNLDLALEANNIYKLVGNATNNKLNSLTKVVFFTLLKRLYMAGNNRDEIESVRAVTIAIWHSLKKCITGQLEGLTYYYNSICLPPTSNLHVGIQGVIEKKLATIKEECFLDSITSGYEENVHFINTWRNRLKNVIGISCDYEDPYKILAEEVSDTKTGSILHCFFNEFTIKKVVTLLLDYINSDFKLVTLSFNYFKNISDQEIRMKNECNSINNNVTNYELLVNAYKQITLTYFEYEEILGYEEIEYKKLKVDGLLQILYSMKIINCNYTN